MDNRERLEGLVWPEQARAFSRTEQTRWLVVLASLLIAATLAACSGDEPAPAPRVVAPTPTAATLIFSSVSAGFGHACGIKPDSSVACRGSNYSGEITPPPGSFNSVSAGSLYTCGVRTDATVTCWGENTV